MKIQIDARYFNPLYYHIVDALRNPDIRHIYVYGGSSAGKTYSIDQALFTEGLTNNFSSIVFRKEQSSIKDTIYNDYVEINEVLQLNQTMQEFLIKLDNGEKIRFRGLDKADKIKGLKGFKKGLFDELDQFLYEDYSEAKRRFRGESEQQLIYTWNPVSEDHWTEDKIKKANDWVEMPRSIDYIPSYYSTLSDSSNKHISSSGNSLLIKTTYLDNFWVVGSPDPNHGRVDQHVIDEFNWMEKHDYDAYRVYGLGEPGTIRKGNEWAKDFERSRNVKDVHYNNELPLHISFDFNVKPYMTLLIFQVEYQNGTQQVNLIKEYCLAHPKNNTEDTAKSFISDFQDHNAGVYVYGDASGKNRSTLLKGERHNYNIIFDELRGYVGNYSDKVLRSNPPIAARRPFLNKLLIGGRINININSKCINTIGDLEKLKEDKDGSFVKETARDPVTKKTYESIGHCMDAMMYFLCQAYKKEFKSPRLFSQIIPK